ncbi:MAG: hypothetical protein WBG10_17585 [Pseudolabrys sp.]
MSASRFRREPVSVAGRADVISMNIDAAGHAEHTYGHEQFPRELGFLWLAEA